MKSCMNNMAWELVSNGSKMWCSGMGEKKYSKMFLSSLGKEE